MSIQEDDPILTACALGELDEAQRQAVEEQLKIAPQLQREVDAIRQMAVQLEGELQMEDAIDNGKTPANIKGRRRVWLLIKVAAVLVVVLGLAAALTPTFYKASRHSLAPVMPGVQFEDIAINGAVGGEPGASSGSRYLAGVEAQAPSHQPSTGQKLIYNARMSAVVQRDQADAFAAKLTQRVTELGGYVSDAQASRQSGSSPGGTIKLRLPSDKLRELMDWVGGTATIESSSLNVQDITELYVDLDARLANLVAAEKRLIELLAKETGKLEEVLKVEQELRNVRQQIEQLQGRKRLWDNQVALSTLDVSYRVAEIYRAEAPETQSFGEKVNLTMKDSWHSFTGAMGRMFLGIVYALPWLPLAAVPLVVVYVARRGSRKSKG